MPHLHGFPVLAVPNACSSIACHDGQLKIGQYLVAAFQSSVYVLLPMVSEWPGLRAIEIG